MPVGDQFATPVVMSAICVRPADDAIDERLKAQDRADVKKGGATQRDGGTQLGAVDIQNPRKARIATD